MVRKADFIEQRDQLLAAMDQPSIDGVNTWFVARAAASQGIKVALSGLGGDERSHLRLEFQPAGRFESLFAQEQGRQIAQSFQIHRVQTIQYRQIGDRRPPLGFGDAGAFEPPPAPVPQESEHQRCPA
mgnify:CR=1 FL=1